MRITATMTGTQAVRDQLQRIGTLPARALAAAAEDVDDYARDAAAKHHVTGAMETSTYMRRDGAGWVIGHDPQRAPYTVFVHWGTKPHKIGPKNKRVLRWPGGRAWHFATFVQHPGYPGDPWMTRAAALAPRAFGQHLQALMQRNGA